MTAVEAARLMLSQMCQCGGRKTQRDALCRRCYRLLPLQVQVRLHLPIGSGFEAAYAEAVERLRR